MDINNICRTAFSQLLEELRAAGLPPHANMYELLLPAPLSKRITCFSKHTY